MTDKTRAKIEAMTKEFYNSPKSITLGAYDAGAEPWAVWCERLHRRLDTAILLLRKTHYDESQSMEKELKEYMEFLDDK